MWLETQTEMLAIQIESFGFFFFWMYNKQIDLMTWK